MGYNSRCQVTAGTSKGSLGPLVGYSSLLIVGDDLLDHTQWLRGHADSELCGCKHTLKAALKSAQPI